MRVLAVSGNPKRSGALADLTEEVLRGASDAGAEVEMIRLAEKDISWCRFCLKCHDDSAPTIAPCIQKDDMAEILLKIKDADGIILACPVCGGHPNSLMNTFMERSVWPLSRPTKRILWIRGCPESRIADKQRRAVVASTAGVIPTCLGFVFHGANSEMASCAKGIYNAEIVGKVFAGSILKRGLTRRAKRKAYGAGRELVTGER